MKFWQKIFLGTFIIFIIIFDAGVYVIASYSNNFNRQREADSSIREQEVILSSFAKSVNNSEKVFSGASQNKERLLAIITPLADYYAPQGVLLALYEHENIVYSNISDIDESLLKLKNPQSKNTMDMISGNKRHMYVASTTPDYPHLVFVYARDISRADDFRRNIGRVFLIINVVVIATLGISVFLLLKYMTRPITKLNMIASEIADGAYDKRVTVTRSDELGKLGQSFNRMADSVEENIVRLTKAVEERQQFVDDLTHEMKTPLTSILGYAEYLQNAKSTEEERIIAVGHLHGAAIRLDNLSVKLLELAFTRGEKLKFQAINVTVLFSGLSETMRPSLASRGITLATYSDIEYVSGDETLLLSMLTNLVENAARASKENDNITVRAYQENCPVIEVMDEGCGIADSEIEKITAPFYRVDKSRSRESGGVGLGLSIVSQIAELHGAKLEIESQLGKGTTVKIYFTTP